jgi:uncharacterized membrane protein (DUF485 family)
MEMIRNVKNYIALSMDFSGIFLRTLVILVILYVGMVFVNGDFFNPFMSVPNPDGVDVAKGIRVMILVLSFVLSITFPSLLED